MEQEKVKKGYEKGGNSLHILKNSQLDCANCIFVYQPDDNVGGCAVYNLKPSKVLDGGKCSEKQI